jgi:hypothetical protein
VLAPGKKLIKILTLKSNLYGLVGGREGDREKSSSKMYCKQTEHGSIKYVKNMMKFVPTAFLVFALLLHS